MQLKWNHIVVSGITALVATVMTQRLQDILTYRRSQTTEILEPREDLFDGLDIPDLDGVKAKHEQMIADGRNMASIVGDFYTTLIEWGIPEEVAAAIVLQKLEGPSIMVYEED